MLQHGFSLIELLIAMSLSLILLAGILTVFAGSRSTYETADRLARLQENGRFALDQIVHDIRAAGYLGCAGRARYRGSTLNDGTALPWNFHQAVMGFDASGSSWSPALDPSVESAAVGSDVLVLRVPERDAVGAPLLTAMSNTTSSFKIAHIASQSLSSGDVVLLANCEAEVALQITSYNASGSADTIAHAPGGATSTSPGNLTDDIGYPFPAYSQVVPVHTVVYYLRQSGSSAAASCTLKHSCSLWRRKGLNAPEELVEGIDAMQVLYGIDANDDGVIDRYANAASVAADRQWDQVMSVQLALLGCSGDEYGSERDSKLYELLDTTAGPYGDRRMRKVFTATASLRNRTA